jgi:hypothetical protein
LLLMCSIAVLFPLPIGPVTIITFFAILKD